jgi:hypothetical protein
VRRHRGHRAIAALPLNLGRLLALTAALGVGVLFWHSPLLWPLKLLVAMMHESGHALATLLVGGQVDQVLLRADESGACLSRIPTGFWAKVTVYSAGYVGSALAGAGLLVATWRFGLRRSALAATCVWLGVMGVLYAGDLFTLGFCIGTAALLGAGARWLPDAVVEWLILFIAAFSALYVVFDLRDDLWDHRVRSISDAALLAAVTPLPAIVWAALWTLFSLAILGGGLWLALRHRPKDYVRGRMR